MLRRRTHRCASWLASLAALLPMHSQSPPATPPKPAESLQFAVEWRMVRAGTVVMSRSARAGGAWQTDLHLEAVGLVSKLYRVNDQYRTQYDSAFCSSTTTMHAD